MTGVILDSVRPARIMRVGEPEAGERAVLAPMAPVDGLVMATGVGVSWMVRNGRRGG